MDKKLEVENAFLKPVYDRVKTLRQLLGYEIPIFKPGKSAIQSVLKTQVVIVCNNILEPREPKTLGGNMWETNSSVQIIVSVPEKVPNIDIHKVAEDFCNYLVEYYSSVFCNDVDQTYVDSTWWENNVDELNRTEYTTNVLLRYFDYPRRIN